MAVPFLPVTFCPMVVPPVPGGAAQNRSWKVQPGSASWVTLSYFSTTMAFSGVFWKVRVLLSPAVEDDDLLGGGFLHLETGSGFHFRHGVLAGIEPLALLMEPDLTPWRL